MILKITRTFSQLLPISPLCIIEIHTQCKYSVNKAHNIQLVIIIGTHNIKTMKCPSSRYFSHRSLSRSGSYSTFPNIRFKLYRPAYISLTSETRLQYYSCFLKYEIDFVALEIILVICLHPILANTPNETSVH